MNEISWEIEQFLQGSSPLVIAEIGINHEGGYQKSDAVLDDAAASGCELSIPVSYRRR